MSYRVEFHASALAQLQGLPPSAFDALVERVGKLVGAPWETQSLDRDEPSFRQCIFGGLGLLSFHVDDRRELIRIFDVATSRLGDGRACKVKLTMNQQSPDRHNLTSRVSDF